ncbi:MAG: EAL domain-containing protein [Solirubrobacterales bacterium]
MDLVGNGELCAAYQPIVELESGRVVGYEALARGPSGSALESPRALFAAAAADSVTEPFDRACREVAVQGALEAELGRSELLFVNVEPTALSAGGVLDRLSDGELERLSVVVELTERDLAARPGDVLAAVHWLRRRNCRVALDDVGVDPRSLALMPFLSPDVIKLDVQLTKNRMPEPDAARLLNAVSAEAERSGAVLLAEGIENEQDKRRAIALGATLGQGWLFGRPGPLERAADVELAPPLSPRHPAEAPTQTPLELIAASRELRRGDKRLLLALSRQLEREALALHGEAVVISTFQDASFFTPGTRLLYERLGKSAALVGALGVGLAAEPGSGVRGASLSTEDRLCGEWDVLVVGPHFASAFVARDLGDACADLNRRFDYFVTHDRELVLAAARSLLPRILPIA